MDHVGQISSIVEDHVEGLSTRESGEGLLNAPAVLFLGLSLPSVDGNASGSDAVGERNKRNPSVSFGKDLRGSSVVLGRENVLSRDFKYITKTLKDKDSRKMTK